jgi:hypothetical protein
MAFNILLPSATAELLSAFCNEFDRTPKLTANGFKPIQYLLPSLVELPLRISS